MKSIPNFRLRALSVAVALASTAVVAAANAQENVNLETVEVTAEAAGRFGYSDAEREPQ